MTTFCIIITLNFEVKTLKKRITFVVSILIVVGSFFVSIKYFNGTDSTTGFSTPTPTSMVAMGTPTAAPTMVPTSTPAPTDVPTETPTAEPTIDPTLNNVFENDDFF